MELIFWWSDAQWGSVVGRWGLAFVSFGLLEVKRAPVGHPGYGGPSHSCAEHLWDYSLSLSLFLKKKICSYLKFRVNAEKLSIPWFTVQMALMTWACPAWSHESGLFCMCNRDSDSWTVSTAFLRPFAGSCVGSVRGTDWCPYEMLAAQVVVLPTMP